MADASEPELPKDWDEPEVESVLIGAVDLHVHPGPSPLPRRLGILEAARDAAAAGYRAIVVKSHHHSMVTDVAALHEAGLGEIGVAVHAGVVLNSYVGGINPYAVELCLALGGRVVWFPTYSSHAHIAHNRDRPTGSTLRRLPPISVLDEDGRILPAVTEVLELAHDHDAIVTGGHLAAREIDALFAEARRVGVERFLINHPQYVVEATPETVGAWARLGAYVEHSVGMYHDSFGHKPARWPLEYLRAYITAVGTAHTVLVSDTGQAGNLRPVDTIRACVRQLRAAGYRLDELRAMTGGNAAELLFG